MTDRYGISGTPYYRYARENAAPDSPVCEYVRLACQRFLNDLDRPEFDFRPDRVDRVVKFIGNMRHFKGRSAGKRFILEPWQHFIVANLYGFYKMGEDGRPVRRFTQAYIEMARKQGKTALAAALALYHMIYDHEHGAECILAASSREQAGICYELCTGFAKSVDRNGKYIHIVQKGIDYKKTMSKLKVISADASKQDGFNASFAVVDEYHAHRNSKLYDVIKSSMGFRRQPLLMTITTAGFSKDYPCYEMRRTNIEVLRGMKQDDARFCIIYTLDEGDDWTDEKVWHKCSPNLGVTVNYSYLRDQVTSAQNSPSEEVGVLTKNFNVWTDTSEIWIPSKYIDAFSPEGWNFDFEQFRDQACWIGVDLASTSDLTGVAVMFVPEEAMKTSPNRDQYREYVRTGDIILTPGNVTDYDYITQYILNLVITFGLVIQGIFYDRWNATFWAIKATQEGLPLIPFGQGLMNFSGPTKEFERLTLSGCILCASSALMRWCFRNVVLMRDHNENSKPSKNSRNLKIDLVICMIEALGGYMSQMGLIPDIFGINTPEGKK